MNNPIRTLTVSTLACTFLFAGCASQEAPPTAREEAERAADRAKGQAELAHKYALWSTPQLICERENLGRKINSEGTVVAPWQLIAVIAFSRNSEQNRFNELTEEIQRRQAVAQSTHNRTVASSAATRTDRPRNEDPYEKWKRETGQR